MAFEIGDQSLHRIREELFTRRIDSGIEWLREHHDRLMGLRAGQPNAAKLVGYFSQWVDAGYGDVCTVREMLSRFPSAERLKLPLDDCVYLLLAEGMVAANEQEGEEALRCFNLIIAMAHEVPMDKGLLALAQFWKARALGAGGDYEGALTYTAKARELALDLGYGKLSAVMKVFESWVYVEQDNLPQAASVLEEAGAVLGETDDWVSLGSVDFGYGLIAVQEGRYYQAIEHFTHAIRWYRKCDAPKRLALALENMAIVKRFLSLRLTRSIDAKLERRRAGARKDGAKGITHGDALQRCEQFRSEAFSELADAETLYRSIQDNHGVGSVRIVRGFLYLDKGELDCGVVEASDAFELGLERKNYLLLARSRILQSKIEGAKYEEGIDEGYDPSLHAQRAHDYAQDALGFANRTKSRNLLAAAYIRIGLTMCNDFFNYPNTAGEYCNTAAEYLTRSRRDHIWEEYHKLKTFILRGGRSDTTARGWAEGIMSDKTLRQMTDEFDQMVILQVWEREERKVSRVARKLSISPKKVRRILARVRPPAV